MSNNERFSGEAYNDFVWKSLEKKIHECAPPKKTIFSQYIDPMSEFVNNVLRKKEYRVGDVVRWKSDGSLFQIEEIIPKFTAEGKALYRLYHKSEYREVRVCMTKAGLDNQFERVS